MVLDCLVVTIKIYGINMSIFKSKNCDNCAVWIPELRAKRDLHSDVLNRQDLEIQKLREQINVLTILALGEPKDIASYQWRVWEKAKDELYPYYSTARECVDRQSRINQATIKYQNLKAEMDVLKEDYEHLRKL